MNYLNTKHFFALISLLIGVFFISLCFSKVAYAEPAVAQVVWVKGSLNAAAPKVDKPRILKRGDIVYEHDTLTTTKGSSGQIVFSDSGLLSLKEETVFRIDEYKFNKGQDPSQEKYVATLVKGGLRTITGAISKGHPENFKLATPVATIGVRGTELRVDWTEDTGLAVGVYQGLITVKNPAGELVLDSSSSQAFTQIKSVTQEPVASSTPPPVLKEELPMQEVKPPASLETAPPSDSSGVAPAPSSSTGGDSGTSGGSTSGGSTTGSTTSESSGTGSSGEGTQKTSTGDGASGGSKTNPSSGDFNICN